MDVSWTPGRTWRIMMLTLGAVATSNGDFDRTSSTPAPPPPTTHTPPEITLTSPHSPPLSEIKLTLCMPGVYPPFDKCSHPLIDCAMTNLEVSTRAFHLQRWLMFAISQMKQCEAAVASSFPLVYPTLPHVASSPLTNRIIHVNASL